MHQFNFQRVFILGLAVTLRHTLITGSLVALLCPGPASRAKAEQTEQYDVVIYGGTSAGVVAAVQTARMGKSVVVIAPGRHLGGLSSSGLGWTDSGNKAVIGGIAREFYRRIRRHYDNDHAWVHEKKTSYGRYRTNSDAMWTFEPKVAEKIFGDLIREQKVPVVLDERLNLKTGVKKSGTRITEIVMESGRAFRGRCFIDATYEGDLMACAGVSYTVGREANSQYGETLNGVQTQRTIKHQFIRAVDPYVKPGDPGSGLLPGINDKPGKDGHADHRLQAYNFRVCMTDVPDNRVEFEKPAGYDPLEYELLLRNFEAGDSRLPLKIDMMPNRKTDLNNNHAISTDFIGRNYDYPDGDYAIRARIMFEHENYIRGLLWTLANHPRVPESIRRKASRWGLARDEFTDNNHWPYTAYIREARRMVGAYVHTELDCRCQRVAEDPVAMGSYNMDSHNAQRYVTPEGHVRNEGDIQINPGGPYSISYRCLVPKSDECSNLLVPVCVSSSHIAFGSIRMEPVFMILGQSAATAACQSIDAEVAVQSVPYAALRERLLADGQVLEYSGGERAKERFGPQQSQRNCRGRSSGQAGRKLAEQHVHHSLRGCWLSARQRRGSRKENRPFRLANPSDGEIRGSHLLFAPCQPSHECSGDRCQRRDTKNRSCKPTAET